MQANHTHAGHTEETAGQIAGRIAQGSPGAEPVRHSHHHDPEEKKRQLNRISRAIGHLNHVKGMIEDDVDCADVLMQLSAVNAALRGLGKQIISEHMTHCISHAIEDGDMTAVEDFRKAVEKFI